MLRSDEIDSVVNACDAGREGELIFAYVYETAKVKKPVKRLWLSSMTRKAIQEAFERLRDGEEMLPLEAAARSRSEADWIVGMNATRAASIRLRAAFDGAVSLGRVQTPTLALIARREEEIRNFKPEPYWLVEAKFEATGDRRYDGRYLGGKRIAEDLAAEIVEACRGKQGEITKLEKKEERERSQLLYDLTSLQRHANTLLRVLRAPHARRGAEAVRAAQGDHLPAHELALAVGRPRRGDPAHRRARREEPAVREGRGVRHLAEGASARAGSSTTRRSPTTTRSSRRGPSTTSSKMGDDERKVYDLVAKRFLAIFHPEAVYERTRVETTVEEHVFRTSGRRLLEAGWKSVYGEEAADEQQADDDSGGDQTLPKLEQGETVDTLSVESLAQGDAAAAALHRGVAPGRDGDGRQGHRGRRAARGDEGLGHRHARHARRDHRAAPVRSATSSATAARCTRPRRACR